MTAEVVLDCRWLGIGGAGRVTELLLQGLVEDPPERRWVLWGPARVSRWAWSGATMVVNERDPRQWQGQRDWFAVPECRLAVFLHQGRPLRRIPSVTWVYDTTALRHGAAAWERRLRRLLLRRLAAGSERVLTPSQISRERIRRDLGIADDRIRVLTLPVDWARADRVRARRLGAAASGVSETPYALFLGRFAPHKNLPRLVAAFETTEFRARSGGRLVLVGGSRSEVETLRRSLRSSQRRFVDVRGWCDDPEVDALMAGSRFLVQPSLEEGFGLPVAEALAAGLPVCVSDGGALPEVTSGMAEPFAAASTEAMAVAIDRVATAALDGGQALADRLAEQLRARLPTQRAFAGAFRQVVDGTLSALDRAAR